jgi:uncharacterized protein HemY
VISVVLVAYRHSAVVWLVVVLVAWVAALLMLERLYRSSKCYSFGRKGGKPCVIAYIVIVRS